MNNLDIYKILSDVFDVSVKDIKKIHDQTVKIIKLWYLLKDISWN